MGFYNMMSGWGGAWTSWTMYLGMIIFWVGVVALVIWSVKALVPVSTVVAPAIDTRGHLRGRDFMLCDLTHGADRDGR